MGGGIDGRDEIAHAARIPLTRRIIQRHRRRESGGEPRRKADTRPLDDRFELAQPRRAGAITELGGGLQAQHFCCESPSSSCSFGRRQHDSVIASLTAPCAAATHARARLRS